MKTLKKLFKGSYLYSQHVLLFLDGYDGQMMMDNDMTPADFTGEYPGYDTNDYMMNTAPYGEAPPTS